MNFLMLIPGLFELLEKVVGPMLSSTKGSIVSKLVDGTFDGTSGSFLSIVEGAFGKIEDQKKLELRAELETLLAQNQTDIIEAQSPHFFEYGARPFLFWGLSLALLMSVLVEPTINYILGFFGVSSPVPFVLAGPVLYMLGGLCGLHIVTKSVDKWNQS